MVREVHSLWCALSQGVSYPLVEYDAEKSFDELIKSMILIADDKDALVRHFVETIKINESMEGFPVPIHIIN